MRLISAPKSCLVADRRYTGLGPVDAEPTSSFVMDGRWLEFQAWVRDELPDLTRDVDGLAQALASRDPLEVELAAMHLERDAESLLDWLRAHPAAPCCRVLARVCDYVCDLVVPRERSEVDPVGLGNPVDIDATAPEETLCVSSVIPVQRWCLADEK
jgi:hypothetical protein